MSVFSGPRITQRFREIAVLSESGALLDAIATRFEAAGAQHARPRALVARALGLGGTPPPEIGSVTLGGAATAGDVVRRALSSSVIRLLRHDPGVRLGIDAEDVHQARVATRRLRSDLRTFRPLLDEAWAEALRDDLRWLGGELGRVRDAEVLRDRLRTAADHAARARSRCGHVDRRPAGRVRCAPPAAISCSRSTPTATST